MNISFTGTRQGFNAFQASTLHAYLEKYKSHIAKAFHGNCNGADIQFHKLLREVFGRTIWIGIYPSNINNNYEVFKDADWVAPFVEPPLIRNQTLVDSGDVLLATPRKRQEELRSGTWHTIRYARLTHHRVEIFWPEELPRFVGVRPNKRRIL